MDLARKFQKELNAGVTAIVTLAVVQRAGRPTYGYEIATQLSAMADSSLPMTPGAVYPVLRSLERSGLLASTVKPSVSGPPRRYYSMTAAGTAALDEWKGAWERTRTLVDRVLENRDDRGSKRSARRAPLS